MSIQQAVRKILWRLGYDISRFDAKSHVLARRRRLLEYYKIDTLLDVGANRGQFALQMRKDLGFSGRIISFEPVGSAFQLLKMNADRDPNWRVINCALGEEDAKCEINVAGNSYSSSFLNMLPSHLKSAPESRYVRHETVEVKTLDSVMDDLALMKGNFYLKMDTQGYENRVINGAKRSLSRIDTLHLEMSLTPLYQEALLFSDMHKLLSDKGYKLVSLEPVFCDKETGQLLQVDGIYHRFS
jgi:FkbM family methyltransferase